MKKILLSAMMVLAISLSASAQDVKKEAAPEKAKTCQTDKKSCGDKKACSDKKACDSKKKSNKKGKAAGKSCCKSKTAKAETPAKK